MQNGFWNQPNWQGDAQDFGRFRGRVPEGEEHDLSRQPFQFDKPMLRNSMWGRPMPQMGGNQQSQQSWQPEQKPTYDSNPSAMWQAPPSMGQPSIQSPSVGQPSGLAGLWGRQQQQPSASAYSGWYAQPRGW